MLALLGLCMLKYLMEKAKEYVFNILNREMEKIFKVLIENIIPKKKRKTEVKSSNNCHYKDKN